MGISEQEASIVTGFWRNYDLPAWRNTQLLVTDKSAQVITNVVAVLLALTLPRLAVFLKLLVPALLDLVSKCRTFFSRVETYASGLRSTTRPRQAQDEFSDDTVIVEPPGPIRLHDLDRSGARIASGVGDSITNADSFTGAASRIVENHLAMNPVRLPAIDQPTRKNRLANMLINFREDPWTFTWLSAVVILLILITIGQQIIAISTAYIVTDSAALLTSPLCGVWFTKYYSNPTIRFNPPSEDGNPPPPKHYTNFPNERDLKSISYAETCYSENARDGECSNFFRPAIPFEEVHNSSCPFAKGTCLYGDSGAYTVDTGYLDSSLLGFNEPVRCEFRMQSTCSPIRPNEPYVRSKEGSEPGSREVSYYFGQFGQYSSDPNFTKAVIFPERTKQYFRSLLSEIREVYIEEFPPPLTGLGRLVGYDQVRAEFKVPYAFTTIFLVSSKAYYAAPSDDPIFPAVPGDGIQSKFGKVCWNNLQRHTILACSNSMVIRHPRTGALWYPYFSPDSELEKPEWNEPPVTDSVIMLNLSFVIPDKYVGHYSFKNRQFAIHNKRDILFSPIAPEHWKTEVQRLFKIRLARLQMDVVGVAQGLGHELPGAVDELAKRGQSEACRHIKIQKQGWKNISLVGLVGFLLLDFVIWLFTIEVDETIAVVWFTKLYMTPVVVRLWQFLNKVLFGNLFRYTRRVAGIVRDVDISLGRLMPWKSRQ